MVWYSLQAWIDRFAKCVFVDPYVVAIPHHVTTWAQIESSPRNVMQSLGTRSASFSSIQPDSNQAADLCGNS